jgi:hypothetical protein
MSILAIEIVIHIIKAIENPVHYIESIKTAGRAKIFFLIKKTTPK